MRTEWLVGFHAVIGALEAGRSVDLAWLQKGRRDHRTRQVAQAARGRGVPVQQVARDRLDAVAEGVPHNGCAVRVSPVEYVALEGLFEEGATTGIVVLDSVTDPHNIGAVVRTAAAFSIGGVVIAGPSAPPLGGALAKAAAGCLDRVRLARTNVAADALVTSRDAGCWVLGADACGQSITSIRPTDRWVLCMGSEERGLRAKTRSQVDELVSIPMASGVESLNLSVAAGILLYHLCFAKAPTR